MAAGDRGRDQLGGAVVSALLAEFGRREADPGESQGQIALVAGRSRRRVAAFAGLVAGRRGRGAGREIAGDRRPQMLRLGDFGGQAHLARVADCGRGRGRRLRLGRGACRRRVAARHALAGVGHLEHAPARSHPAAHAAAHAAHAAHAHAAHHAARAAEAAARLERIHPRLRVYRDHEVGHGIDLHDHRLGGLVLRGDHQDLVLDEVREVEVAQEQAQGRAQRDPRHALCDGRLQVEAGVFERLRVDLHRNALGVLDLGDHVAERRLGEFEVLDRLLERLVDPLLVAARAGEVDRLVLLAEFRDLAPAGRVGVDDRRLVGQRDRRHVDEVQAVHEPALHVALRAHVLGVVVANLGLDERLPGEHAGRHRHRVVRKQVGRLLHQLLAGEPFRLGELRGRGLGPRDRVVEHAGVVAQHRRIPLGPVVADADPLLDEGVVAFGELLDPPLATPKVFVEPHPLPADRAVALGGEVALRLLPGPHDRLADADLDLAGEALAGAGVEILGRLHGSQQFLEVGARAVGIGRHPLAGVAQAHGRLLLQDLGPHLAQAGEFGQFGGVVRDVAGGGGGRGIRVGGRRRQRLRVVRRGGRVGGILGVASLGLREFLGGHSVHEARLDVVGVAPQRRHGQPQGRRMGAGGLRLPGERGQRRRLGLEGAPRDVEPFAPEQRQERPVVRERVAEQFAEVGVLEAGLGLGDLDHGLPLGVALGRALEHHVEPALLEPAPDQQDRIAVGPKRRQATGQPSVVGRGCPGRQHHVLRPEHGADGQRSQAGAGIPRRRAFLGHQQHPAGGVGHGGQARPVHLPADADARHRDPSRAQLFLDREEVGGVDAVEPRAVAHVDDRPAGRRGLEQVGRGIQNGDDVGRSERRAVGEFLEGRTGRGTGRRREAFVEGRAPDVDGRDPEAIARAGLVEEALDGVDRSGEEVARLARRRVDEQHHVDRAGGFACRRRPQADGHDRRGEITAAETLRERDRGRIVGVGRRGGARQGGQRREQEQGAG